MSVLIFAVWLILNGKITVEICLFGLGISAALFSFMCRYMDYSIKKKLCCSGWRLFCSVWLGID